MVVAVELELSKEKFADAGLHPGFIASELEHTAPMQVRVGEPMLEAVLRVEELIYAQC
jgi:hypothetical protein